MNLRFRDLFDAISRGTHEFLSAAEGLSVPSYQRDYSWDTTNIQRLFADLLHGIRRLVDDVNAVSFLGTLITIDADQSTINSLDATRRTRVKTLVDGQQRICTLLMCNIALHDHIRRMCSTFADRPEKHFAWIHSQCTEILTYIESTFLLDTRIGDTEYRYFPKLIRALSDKWSNYPDEARYRSPVPRLIWEYRQHYTSNRTTIFLFDPGAIPPDQREQYTVLRSAFASIRAEIRSVLRGSPDHDFPALKTATHKPHFFESMWQYRHSREMQGCVADYVADGTPSDSDYRAFAALLQLTILARYLNDRVAVTVVSAKNEDDAFDIFEALNTTGTPLTAFETFKPRVIEFEGDAYPTSVTRDWIEAIDHDLGGFTKADARESATSDVLIPFALSETGRKLARRLTEQRRYLRDEYDKLKAQPDPDPSRSFVRALSQVSAVVNRTWNADMSAPFRPLCVRDEVALLALVVLHALNHSITLAPISRFYQSAVESTDSVTKKQRTHDFEAALRATGAFSALWRAAKRGTGGIDSQYRDLMRSGVAELSVLPLARRANGSHALAVAEYKRALLYILKRNDLGSKDAWCDAVANLPIYTNNKRLARFVLFCALHETVPDDDAPPLVRAGLGGIPPLLTPRKWRDDKYLTVEHIAPKTKAAGWDDDIYTNPEFVHTLGNLTLLPAPENSVVGARSWDDKRAIYWLWASRTQKDFDCRLERIQTRGMALHQNASGRIGEAGFIAACESLASFSESWSVDVIRVRGRCLAELAWRRLQPWLAV